MLVTARSGYGAAGQRGVVGYARSADLVRWQVQPPLSRPDTGFWHLEVQQVEVVAGRPVLIFSCLPDQLSGERQRASGPGAIWCVPADSALGPFDTSRAVPVSGAELYSGRLIRDRSGQWVMLAFRNQGTDGFVGEISDPVPVTWALDGSGLTAGLAASQPGSALNG